jgi:hypothetical protein
MVKRLNRGKKTRTRGDTVVDQYHAPVLHRGRPVVAAVGMAPAFKFGPLAFDGLREISGSKTFVSEYIVVPDGNATIRNRARGELFLPRHANLAHEPDIERGCECPRYFVRDRNSAARQRKDYRSRINLRCKISL